MKALGFKNKIIMSVIILVTACLLVSNWFAYIHLKDNTIESVALRSQSIVHYESLKIESWFKDKANAIQALASKYKKTKMLTTSIYVDDARLARETIDVSGIYISLDDGQTYSTAEGENWVNGVIGPSKFDARTRPWYAMAKSTNGVAFTDSYIDKITNKPVVSIVRSFGDGVVLADVTLSFLEKTVKEIDFPGAVFAIMDKNGKALASSSTALTVGTTLSEIGMSELHDSMLGADKTTVEYTISGVDKIGFTESIKLADGSQWYLILAISKSIAYSEVDTALTNAITSSIMMLLIAIVISLFTLNAIYQPIIKLKEMVVDLSTGNGDLTRRLEVKIDDDLGLIATGVNDFIGDIQSLMLEVSESSKHISNSVEELNHQVENNNGVLDSHACETNQIVTAIEEMSSTANDVANNASEAASFTQKTNVQVSESLEKVTVATESVSQLVDDVDNASSTISGIAENTQEITNVLNVIGSIAEQTNLLALNAAIEAARAGEHGRGFAVVADEVRSLASSTKNSTSEIEVTLNKLLAGSQSANDAMQATKDTCEKTTQGTRRVAEDLTNIDESVTSINDLTTLIATAAEEQSAVTEEITRNMSSLQDMVVVLTDNGHLTGNETQKLAEANSQLKEVVNKFKLV